MYSFPQCLPGHTSEVIWALGVFVYIENFLAIDVLSLITEAYSGCHFFPRVTCNLKTAVHFISSKLWKTSSQMDPSILMTLLHFLHSYHLCVYGNITNIVGKKTFLLSVYQELWIYWSSLRTSSWVPSVALWPMCHWHRSDGNTRFLFMT